MSECTPDLSPSLLNSTKRYLYRYISKSFQSTKNSKYFRTTKKYSYYYISKSFQSTKNSKYFQITKKYLDNSEYFQNAKQQVVVLWEPAHQFYVDAVRLIRRCTKPNQREFLQIAKATAVGFCIMGFIGFIVKLIHIPVNNILV
ncbi:hypothetical protein Pcinc_037457 [Petrolisthes cinctipes]|uniref:Protein transport protein Sec61 subunit gamma n=1 Tax=Petrolisthes cinctipes TaxID=88211 RepID=A0AAE1BU05_PETCI|nr:hypothetical protein Pcinc_037457 [Petrolisthes cinctipes]